jgi:hypothetical protein
MSWKKTKLKQFADLHAIISNPNADPKAVSLTIYEYLTGKDPVTQSYSSLAKWSKRNAWVGQYPKNIKSWLWCGGLYRITLNPAHFNGDMFTTMAAHSGNIVDHLPEIMATLCKPVWKFGEKDWVKRVQYFRKHMTVWQAYGTAVFFWRLWTLLQAGGLQYSPNHNHQTRTNLPLHQSP